MGSCLSTKVRGEQYRKAWMNGMMFDTGAYILINKEKVESKELRSVTTNRLNRTMSSSSKWMSLQDSVQSSVVVDARVTISHPNLTLTNRHHGFCGAMKDHLSDLKASASVQMH
jgi:hypothetical protein